MQVLTTDKGTQNAHKRLVFGYSNLIFSYFSMKIRKLKIQALDEPKDTQCFNGYMTSEGDFNTQSFYKILKSNLLYMVNGMILEYTLTPEILLWSRLRSLSNLFLAPQLNSQCPLNSIVFCSHSPCSLAFSTSCSLLLQPFYAHSLGSLKPSAAGAQKCVDPMLYCRTPK